MDELPAFLSFTPVPVKARWNGWTPALQLRFILALARGAGPSEAARALGKSRQTAYALRLKPGGRSFADAWDEAMDFARDARAAGRGPLAGAWPGEPMLVPRYYRGRLIGYVRREDHRAALRTLGMLDRLALRLERKGVDFNRLREVSEQFESYLEALKTDKTDGIRR